MLDLLLTNAEELIREVKTGSSMGCSDHALVEFSILRVTGWAESSVKTLSLRKANFWLIKALLCEIPWETVIRDKGPNESGVLKTFFWEQELSILTCKKLGSRGRKPVRQGRS